MSVLLPLADKLDYNVQRFPALAMDDCLYIYNLTDYIQVIFTEEI